MHKIMHTYTLKMKMNKLLSMMILIKHYHGASSKHTNLITKSALLELCETGGN